MGTSGGEPDAERLRLQDLMSPDVVSVSPDATLREVAEVLAARGIAGLPVVEDGRVVGVISMTDIVDFAASTPSSRPERGTRGRPRTTRVQRGYDERHEPGAYYSGRSGAAEPTLDRLGAGERQAWDLLEEYSARNLMTRTLHALPPDTALPAAADYMLREDVRRVLIMEGETLLGVVTATDFLRALAQGRIR